MTAFKAALRGTGPQAISGHRNCGPGSPSRQHVARLSRQPEHAGHGGAVHRRISGIFDAGAVGRTAASPVRAVASARTDATGNCWDRFCWKVASLASSVRCSASPWAMRPPPAQCMYFGGDLGSGFFSGVKPSVHFDPLAAAIFFMLGLGVTLLGSAVPAWEAASANPAPALKSGSEDTALSRLATSWPALALPGVGGLFTQLPPDF